MTAPSDDAARAHAAASVRAALTSLPLGAALLSAFAERRDVWLVGGAVRDLLLGGLPKELDLVVDGAEVDAVAAGLVERLSGEVRGYDRFGTASVCTPLGGVDLARARREHYRTPGALPMVSPAPLEEDLQRRDFTVNAIAVALGPDPARLCAHPRALADLDGRQLRVLHDASFIDDPTRLLRLARYEARLGFAIEPHTALLAGAAIAGGALATVSGARIGAELRLLLAEPARVAALLALGRAGLLATLDPGLEVDRGLLEAALELAPPDASPEVIALAAVGVPVAQREGPDALRSLLDHLCVPARERGLVLEAAASAAPLSAALAAAIRPSEIRAAVGGRAAEAVALAAAIGGREQALAWLGELRHVRLQIGGGDLLAAGIPSGPAIGAALEATLDRRLDGELPAGREAELEAALAVAAG